MDFAELLLLVALWLYTNISVEYATSVFIIEVTHKQKGTQPNNIQYHILNTAI
jgi:hypothetical protein